MKHITSRTNPRIKELIALGGTRRLGHQGRALIEGIHLCSAFLDAKGVPLSCVVLEEALHDVQTATLVARVPERTVLVVGRAIMETLGTVKTGANMIFEIEVPAPGLTGRISGDALMLDRVQDPGNLGSILRSAAAAGIDQVFCGEGCAQPWSTKVVRAAMGAHFSLKIWEDCVLLDLLGATDTAAISTSSHAAQTVYEQDLRQATIWVFGHEGQGVSDELASRTHPVAIPQPGGLESLNVAAAAAVCLFEQVRQRR